MTRIRATAWNGDTWDDPAEDTLYDLLSELNLVHRFLVVERIVESTDPSGSSDPSGPSGPSDVSDPSGSSPSSDPGQHYIQVYLEDDGSCLVEYREGGPHAHFQARVPAPFAFHGHDIAAGAVKSWARDDDHWRTALPWAPLDGL